MASDVLHCVGQHSSSVKQPSFALWDVPTFFFSYKNLFFKLCVYTRDVHMSARDRETGVTGSCGLPGVGAGNRLLSSEGAVVLLTVEPSPQPPSLTFSLFFFFVTVKSIFLLQALPYLRLFP